MKKKGLFIVILVLLAATLPGRALLPPQAPDIPNLGIVKERIVTYHDSGQYESDIRRVVTEAIDYLAAVRVDKAALVLDIDETSLSNWPYEKRMDFAYLSDPWNAWVEQAEQPPIQPTLDLYQRARQRGVSCFFITGRTERQRSATERSLRHAGYSGWKRLYMEPLDYHQRSAAPFKTSCRKRITEEGYHIVINMGDQISDLDGGYADRTFKLPNPMYYVP